MPEPIALIVGLGNPGPDYSNTRHNAGFWFVDELASQSSASFRTENKFFGETCRVTLAGNDCWLLKPMTFMNESGRSVQALMSFYKIPRQQILVVYDEIDLEPGTIRFKTGGGHGGHNGIRNMISQCGGNDFHRLRVGVGHPGSKAQVVNYVLGRPSKKEQDDIEDAMNRGWNVIDQIVDGQYQKAMNSLHSQ